MNDKGRQSSTYKCGRNATYKKLEVVTLKDRHCKLKQSAKLFLDKQHCIFISEEPITEDILEDEITVWE